MIETYGNYTAVIQHDTMDTRYKRRW